MNWTQAYASMRRVWDLENYSHIDWDRTIDIDGVSQTVYHMENTESYPALDVVIYA